MLVAAYGFDEGRGAKTHDVSGRSNDGQTTDTSWANGKYGSALSFNGSSSSVTIPGTGSLDLTNGMTLEAWVKPSSLAGSARTALFKEQSNGFEYALYAGNEAGLPAGRVQTDGDRRVVGPKRHPGGAWTYLALTYDGSKQTLFLNGAPVANSSASGAIGVSDGDLRIGGNASRGQWFSGLIDEAR